MTWIYLLVSFLQIFVYIYYGARKDYNKIIDHVNKKDSWKYRKLRLTDKQNEILQNIRGNENKIAAHRIAVGGDARVINCSFSVKEQQCLLVFGDSINSNAKHEIMKILIGMEYKSKGKVYFNGKKSYFTEALLRLRTTFYDSQHSLPTRWELKFTIRQLIHNFGLLKGLTPDLITHNTTYLLDVLQLRHFADIPIRELGDSLRDRACLAACMVGGADLIFLNDLTSRLDFFEIALVRNLIEVCKDERKASIVLTGDNLEQANLFCNKIAFFEEVNNQEVGIPESNIKLLSINEIMDYAAFQDLMSKGDYYIFKVFVDPLKIGVIN